MTSIVKFCIIETSGVQHVGTCDPQSQESAARRGICGSLVFKDYRPTIEYFAGLMDGEGGVILYKVSRAYGIVYRSSIDIAQKDPYILRKCMEFFNAGYMYKENRIHSIWRWAVRREDDIIAIARLFRYRCPIKGRQFNCLLEALTKAADEREPYYWLLRHLKKATIES